MTPEEKQSGIPCALVGTDGNIYALLGRTRQALRRGGRPDLVEPMTKEVLASKSYEEAIDIFANMSRLNKGILRKPPCALAAFFA